MLIKAWHKLLNVDRFSTRIKYMMKRLGMTPVEIERILNGQEHQVLSETDITKCVKDLDTGVYSEIREAIGSGFSFLLQRRHPVNPIGFLGPYKGIKFDSATQVVTAKAGVSIPGSRPPVDLKIHLASQ